MSKVDIELSARLAAQFSGPILFDYVWWILQQAQRRNISTLYFLARDGYLLREIAQLFCQKFQLPVQCRYLYCSRAALRTPTYHLIGEEAYDLLLLYGYRVTLSSLLLRAELSGAQQKEVLSDCGLDGWDPDRVLSRQEWGEACHRLRKSQVYRAFIEEKSRAAYPAAVGYFHQEGLFSQNTVALVDSGWTGSMQRSLRQLLRSAGFQGDLIGFYYGMYAAPKAPEDGEYLTWYFNSASPSSVKIPFCNNLFECLLAAPHGMTIGYTKGACGYSPLLLSVPEGSYLQSTEARIAQVRQYAKQRLSEMRIEDFREGERRADSKKRIVRYMAHPRREEALFYGESLFCDDVTEAYHEKLADARQLGVLKGYSIPARVLRRFFRRRAKTNPAELFWPYGTIAFLPCWRQWWYRLNIYIWEWLRYAKQ